MTEKPTKGTAMDAQLENILHEASGAAAIGHPAPRDTLDREEQLIRDAVLRMGALVEAAIREASRALEAHDAALALDGLHERHQPLGLVVGEFHAAEPGVDECERDVEANSADRLRIDEQVFGLIAPLGDCAQCRVFCRELSNNA